MEQESVIRRKPAPKSTFAGFRKHVRHEFQTHVFIQDEDGWEIPLECLNLSANGMFIRSHFLFEIGQIHHLFFRSDDHWYRVTARVVRVDTGEFGIEGEVAPGMAYEFIETDEHTQNHLQAFIA